MKYFNGKENLSIDELRSLKEKLIEDNPDDLIEICIEFQEVLDSKNSKKFPYKMEIERIRVGVAQSSTKDTPHLAKYEDGILKIIRLESAVCKVRNSNDSQLIEVSQEPNGKVLFEI